MMKYNLFNKRECQYEIVLINACIVNDGFSDYYAAEQVEYIKSKCINEPKLDWFSYGDSLHWFDVPLVGVNKDNEIFIIDGRHRVCWMKSKNMLEIPVAISNSTKSFFENKNIIFKPVYSLDMPCEVIPQKTSLVTFDSKATVSEILNILKSKKK